MVKVRLQSGCIPFRKKNGKPQVLLVRKKTKTGWWGFTKGGLEPHLTLEENAAKECFEESGITGRMGPQIGTFTYEKDGVKNHVTMFALEFFVQLESYPEKKVRSRKWVFLDEAYSMVGKEHKRLLDEVSQVFHRL